MSTKHASNKRWMIWIIAAAVIIAALLCGIFLLGSPGEKQESIRDLMKDGVLHEENKIAFLGMEVNPALISAVAVSAFLLLFAAVIRIFVIPRFTYVPGKFQTLLEALVDFFDNLAHTNSPHHSGFLGGYVFSAGVYIFVSTLFELFGFQAVTTQGLSIALPAPLADINAAIAMGCLSYAVILGAGLIFNGGRGVLGVLKDFSLPISMSFRLFGALLSGLLVTELVYYYISLSFVLPVIVGVLFTLLHALVQTYVLTMLTSTFYGEAAEPRKKKVKKTPAK